MKMIILNHKMNLYYNELSDYIDRTNKLNYNLIIAPSNIYLSDFIKLSNHQIASQDVCYIDEGNYTSKVSWKQIKSLGIKYSIIGHSEKHEDLSKTNIKLHVCLSNDIKPILCFGNTTKDENIVHILDNLLKDIDNIKNIIFAYEPLFNIDSNNLDIKYISNQISIIENYLLNKFNQNPTLLYGGGINNDNINDIYNNDLLDGILIGSISSNLKVLEQILSKINEK